MSADKLRDLVAKQYKDFGVVVKPRYPRNLVRKLPREQTSKGGIILTETKQNKPAEEGVVLETFTPFWKLISRNKIEENGRNTVEEISEFIVPSVKVGEHILFPHIAEGITPVWPLDDGKGDYRLVPDQLCMATLDYNRKPLEEELFDLLAGDGEPKNFRPNELVRLLLDNYDLIPKDLKSKVISGR